MTDLYQRIEQILRANLRIAGHDAWEGHYYYVGGIEQAAKVVRALFPPPLPNSPEKVCAHCNKPVSQCEAHGDGYCGVC